MQKKQILKEYIQTNCSIPYRLRNVYCTPCNAKKNLEFDVSDNSNQNSAQPKNGSDTLIRGNDNPALKQNSLLELQCVSPNQSMCSIFFVNRKVVCLNQLVQFKAQPQEAVESQPPSLAAVSALSALLNEGQKMDLVEIGNGIFNVEPYLGVAFFQVFGLLDASVEQMCAFLHGLVLRGCGQLIKSKLAIGRMLTELNVKEVSEIAAAYVSKLAFNMSFCSALSQLFGNFVVENNPEKIDLVLHYFSKQYFRSRYNQEKGQFANEDAAHMLAYATAMLDIEIHENKKVNLK